MKYYLNNRDNRANLAANDFDEFFRRHVKLRRRI